MHHYQHNIGDYRRDTAHLSLLEHGIYRQLLDEYYLKENPIKTESVIRRLRITTDEEKKALNNVLNDFFTPSECGNFWRKNRCDEAIKAYKARAKTARENGAKGGRPKENKDLQSTETENKPSGLFLGTEEKPNGKLTNNHKPITNNQIDKRNISILFDEFWSKYPKKRGKADAKKRFKTVCKDRQTFKNIMSGLDMWLKVWKNTEPDYIPYGSTWLNKERWSDDLSDELKPDSGQSQPSPEDRKRQERQLLINQFFAYRQKGFISNDADEKKLSNEQLKKLIDAAVLAELDTMS